MRLNSHYKSAASAWTGSRAEDQLEAALAQAGIEPSDVLKRARDVYSMHGVVVDAVALLHAAADEDWAAVSTLLETLGVPATRATLTAAEHWTPLAREAVYEALTDAAAWQRARSTDTNDAEPTPALPDGRDDPAQKLSDQADAVNETSVAKETPARPQT